jgi:DNA-binding transcriptional regulator PaaX
MVAETGLTKKTVRKHIDGLEDSGWISIDRSNGGRNNRYTIQSKNVTGTKSALSRVEKAPSNGVNINPLKTNIKTNKKYISKKPVFERLKDKSWADGFK